MRKPICGSVPVVITDEQIAEMRELYAQIRQIKYSHAYSMLCLADTTKEERAFFASIGDINNGRSYTEEQAEVEKLVATIAEGKPWDVAKYEATAVAVQSRAGDLRLIEQRERIITELRRQMQQISAIEKKLVEELEDRMDAAVAEEAYTEYVASGCKSTPAAELWRELGLDDEDEVDEKLQEAEWEAELTNQRYSSDEVLQAMRETIQEKFTFKTNLTMEEIARNFEGVDLFSEIMAGLEETLEYTKGNLHAHTRTLTIEDGQNTEGAFAEQILDELIASGLTGNALLEEFRKRQAQVRPAVKTMIAEAHEAALGNGEYYTYDDVFGVENEPQMKADEAADPFFSESNKEFLRRGIEALDAGEGVEHELLEAKLVNEGFTDIENGKTVDCDAVRTRIAEKYGV